MEILLNVAEKPSVAKEISKVLGGPNVNKRTGISKYNPIYEFTYPLNNREVRMIVSSVQGHIMNMEFGSEYKSWNRVDPGELFQAPLRKEVTADKTEIVKNLESLSRNISSLVLWLDCDREGENIAYEVIEVISRQIQLPPQKIRRAHFSALTRTDIIRAVESLGVPQKSLSDAVDARQELDLRLGAAFTRLQTLNLRSVSNVSLLSWGPCQIPTLGFVVKRFLEIENFIPEDYWTLDLKVKRHTRDVKFDWRRERLFDLRVCLVLGETCIEQTTATVTGADRKQKLKWKPLPLATIPYQKLASSKLKIDSTEAMNIAERLYNKGLISYPRTETDFFKDTINLKELVEFHRNSPDWGEYAERLTEGDFVWPRNGSHDDNSHPPIHPVKLGNRRDLPHDEWRVYELISRHFLACCSADAKGFETVVEVSYGTEKFVAKGLEVAERNFLEVYPYQKWVECELPRFEIHEEFVPEELMINEHKTQAPPLLSETNLIAMMDKAGIGTDATIHQHIKTIQDRGYARVNAAGLFEPTPIGLGLYEGYVAMQTHLHEPELRALMERDMKDIAEGSVSKGEVVYKHLNEMKAVFVAVNNKMLVLKEKMTNRIGNMPLQADRNQNRNGAVCFKCQMEGHYANQCPNQECFKCGRKGHFASNCTAVTQNNRNTKRYKKHK